MFGAKLKLHEGLKEKMTRCRWCWTLFVQVDSKTVRLSDEQFYPNYKAALDECMHFAWLMEIRIDSLECELKKQASDAVENRIEVLKHELKRRLAQREQNSHA